MFTKKTIRDVNVDGKTVLLRVDFNVPLKDGNVEDDYRITQAIPTIQYLLDRNCKVVLISHLGRPEGEPKPEFSLKPVVARLSELLQKEVLFADNCVGASTAKLVGENPAGSLILLENLRFHKEEEANEEHFARQLLDASGAELFVQDAFGVVHRAHASTDAIARCTEAVAGLLLEREVDTITNAIANPQRPLLVVVGGAKISDKIEILNRFIDIADAVAVVGAMANTFLLAEGLPVGDSLVEKDEIDLAQEIIEKATEKSKRERFSFFLPKDVVVSTKKDNSGPTRVVDLSNHNWADITAYPKKPEHIAFEVQPGEIILDIGPFTASHIAGMAKLSKTAIWNGTAGVTEIKGLSGVADPFAHGTKVIMEGLVGERAGTLDHPFAIVGGGDTVDYLDSQPDFRRRFAHVSTGGGASLELMSGKTLPGVEVLQDKNNDNGV